MRLLHVRDDPGSCGAVEGKTQSERGRYSLSDAKAYLPLLQLRENHQSRSARSKGIRENGGEWKMKKSLSQYSSASAVPKPLPPHPGPLPQGEGESRPA